MFSRWRCCLLVSLLGFFFFFGCSLPLNETPPALDDIEVSLGESTACLSNVIPVMDRYFSATAQDAQITEMWNCMRTAVTTFEKSTQGRYEDRFTARELAHFIEQYFLEKGSRIPDSLLTEAFRVKQLFVGGAIDSITRSEMVKTLDVIEKLKGLTLSLNPHMKIYTFKWVVNPRAFSVDTQAFQAANEAIQRAIKELAVLFQSNEQPYELRNALILLQELSKFSSSSWKWLPQVEKALPLVEKLKQALAGGDPHFVTREEWPRFGLLSARGYIQYLRYYYFIQSANLNDGGQQLTYFVESIDDLFSFLGDMVEGKPGQKLTRSELLEMLQALTSFAPKVKVSDELLIEVMKIKVVVFGGGLEDFKKEDFDRARANLNKFEEATKIFLKYSDVYALNWKPKNLSSQEALVHFNAAEESLKQLGRVLSEVFQQSYDLTNVIKFAQEWDKLYPSAGEGSALSAKAQRFVPVVVTIKNILLTDQGGLVGYGSKPQEQWALFFGKASQFFSRYLYYEYFLSSEAITDLPGLMHFKELSMKVISHLDEVILVKPAKSISFDELNRLWVSLMQAELLPSKISLPTLQGLTKVLVQKWLNPPEKRLPSEGGPVPPAPTGLTLVTTATLKEELSYWFKSQEFLAASYQGIPESTGKTGSALMADLNNGGADVPLLELKMILSGPLPLSFDELGRLYLSRPALNYRYSTANMFNLVRSAVRVVIRSYAASLSRIKNYEGITEAEAKALFEDVKPVVVELELLSASSKDFAESRFRDANLFTDVSNGDELANFQELSHLAVMIVSGIKIDSLMFPELEASCKIQKPSALKDTWTVPLNCLTNLYHEKMPVHFASMPDFMAFQSTLDVSRFNAMYLGLLKATGTQMDPAGNVKVADLVLFPNVVQYLEGIFQVYDTDRNGQLNTAECLKAYPTYRAILLKVSGLTNEQDLKGLFTWLLKYGKPPEGADKLKFKLWWVPKGEQGWDVSADREMLAKILGFIADSLANAQTNAMVWRMDL